MFTHLSRIAFFVFLFTAHLCSAQNRFFGTVIEAPDGHSFVLESSVGKVNGVLQYVEVPEPDQALRQTVIDHFRSLTIGKRAEFQVLSMNQSSLAGRLIVNGVDIGNQLLRDGAAWLLPAEQTGQSQGEYISYKESEDQARSEHRGVWSIPNLKPAWLVRAENEERLRLELASKPKPKAKLDIVSQFQTISLPGRAAPLNTQFLAFDKNLWLDVFAGTGIETPGLKTYSDPDRRYNVVYTSVAFVTLSDGKTKQRLECRAGYVDYLLVNGERRAVYKLGFRALSDEYNFSRRLSRLAITVHGHTASFSLEHGYKGNGSIGAIEMMFYVVPRSLLKNMATGSETKIGIDRLTGTMGVDFQNLITQLLTATQ